MNMAKIDILKAYSSVFCKKELDAIEQQADKMAAVVMEAYGNTTDRDVRLAVESVCTVLAIKGYGVSMQKINDLRLAAFREGYEQGKFDTRVVLAQQAEEPTAKWIKSEIKNEKYRCSKCGGACWYYDNEGDIAKSKYCPNCGAKMEV